MSKLFETQSHLRETPAGDLGVRQGIDAKASVFSNRCRQHARYRFS